MKTLGDEISVAYATYQKLEGGEVGYPTSIFIAKICDELQPTVIFDLGSGWSSFLLRSLCPTANVTSVDDNPGWMQKSVDFCASQNMIPASGSFQLFDDFRSNYDSIKSTADLVIHDFGNRAKRNKYLPLALDLVKPGGIIILDDMHKGDLARHASDVLAKRPEFTLDTSTEDETKDSFGRFVWIARRITGNAQ